MKNLVILTGAGMSAESGISTFRDADYGINILWSRWLLPKGMLRILSW